MTEQEIRAALSEYQISTSTESRDGRTVVLAWFKELPQCLAEAADRDAAISELHFIGLPFVGGLLADGGTLPVPLRRRGQSVITQMHQVSQVVLGDVHKLLNARQLSDSRSETDTPNRFQRQDADGHLVAG